MDNTMPDFDVDEAEIERIFNAENEYEILNIGVDASEEVILKAYLTLSLLVAESGRRPSAAVS